MNRLSYYRGSSRLSDKVILDMAALPRNRDGAAQSVNVFLPWKLFNFVKAAGTSNEAILPNCSPPIHSHPRAGAFLGCRLIFEYGADRHKLDYDERE